MKKHSSDKWPETLKSVLIRDGNFKPFFRFLFVVVGVAIIFLDLNVWRTGCLNILGFVMGGIGGYSARAHSLGIKPFEPSPYPDGWLKKWRAAKAVSESDPERPDL